METLYVALWEGEKLGFKSYYVVWKQKQLDDLKLPLDRFKSYYVVWKP